MYHLSIQFTSRKTFNSNNKNNNSITVAFPSKQQTIKIILNILWCYTLTDRPGYPNWDFNSKG